MRRYLPLLLSTLLLIASQDAGATAQRQSKLLSFVKGKVEQFKTDKVGALTWAAPRVLVVLGIFYISFAANKHIDELEHNYRQREIFLQAIARGDRDTVTAQLELEDFPLEKYLDLTIHYQVNGEHRLGVVESVDPNYNAVQIANSDDFVAKAAIEGVVVLDHEKQGRMALFHLRKAHLVRGDRQKLFADRTSGFGTVAGITSSGYLLIRPYVGNREGHRGDAFAEPLLLVHMHDLPSIP